MEPDELINRLKNYVGYYDSEHKDEVIKGATLALQIMQSEFAARRIQFEYEQQEKERLRGQLQTVAAIFAEHAPD